MISLLKNFLLMGALTSIFIAQVGVAVSASSPELTGLENQAEFVRLKSETRTKLEAQKLEITRENEELTVSIKELEKKVADAQIQITSIEQQITQTEQILTESSDSDPVRIEKQQELQAELRGDLDEAKLLLVSLEGERKEKQSLIDKNSELLQFIQQQLAETKEEVNAQRGQFLRIIWIEASDYFIYIIIIGGIILVYLLSKRIIYRFIQNNQTAVLWAEIIVRGIAFILVLIVFIYAFADRIIGLITLFSVFSAALVVALQDFVSSFFAWLYIRGKNQYRIGDVIRISGSNGYFFGKVKRIEILRTVLDESVGNADGSTPFDKERPTGREVSFPNNLILKDALVNFTLNHRTLWQSLDVVITFQSDWQKAEEEVKKRMDRVFSQEWYKEHKIERSFHPQLHILIVDDGVQLSLWFPARIGEYRATLEVLSKEILLCFKEHQIDFAYKSFSIYQDAS